MTIEQALDKAKYALMSDEKYGNLSDKDFRIAQGGYAAALMDMYIESCSDDEVKCQEENDNITRQ